jgi:glycerate-2-kinase
VTTKLLDDALTISDEWRSEVSLRDLIETQLGLAGVLDDRMDIVAIGKASRSMIGACHEVVGDHIARAFVVVDELRESDEQTYEVVVGEHPFPGPGSVRAGERLLEFLAEPTDAVCTVFLVSGGASSLCALPQPPIDIDDLRTIFNAAMASGLDITGLNQLRAATSQIAGGAVVRHVRTERSLALIMVDNVLSGAPWVASGLTYVYVPSEREVEELLGRIDRLDTPLAARVHESSTRRSQSPLATMTTLHRNLVVAQPSLMLDLAIASAQRRGYRVVSLGSALTGDVHDVVEQFAWALAHELRAPAPLCVVGVGEVTVRVHGPGIGGRCQEMAWAMADVLAANRRPGVFVARASDGRDFVAGVAGAWVDDATPREAKLLGIERSSIAAQNDTFHGLQTLDQLIAGSSTGWNLCDLYVTLCA